MPNVKGEKGSRCPGAAPPNPTKWTRPSRLDCSLHPRLSIFFYYFSLSRSQPPLPPLDAFSPLFLVVVFLIGLNPERRYHPHPNQIAMPRVTTQTTAPTTSTTRSSKASKKAEPYSTKRRRTPKGKGELSSQNICPYVSPASFADCGVSRNPTRCHFTFRIRP